MKTIFSLLFIFLLPQTSVAKESILFLGSSSISGWKRVAQDFKGYRVYNKGQGGSTYESLNTRLPQLIKEYPTDHVVLYSGDNDLVSKSPQQVAEDMQASVAIIKKLNPNAKIHVISVKPSPWRKRLIPKARKTNQLMAEALAKRKSQGVNFVNVFDKMLGPNGKIKPGLYGVFDRLHMGRPGYRLWQKEVQKSINSSQ